MPYKLRTAARTHTGLVRDNNEDNYYVGPRILLVADGMGGHAAGEVASGITAEMFAELRDIDLGADLTKPLGDAIAKATAEIARRVEKDPDLEGMGTTATAILFGEKRIAVANIGDSRAYLYQRDSRKLTQLTHDDSFVQLMVENGDITAEQAVHHPYRNIVLKSVNGKDVQPRFTTLVRIHGDRYLVCSDGLTDYVEVDDVTAALDIDDLEDAADKLIDLALSAGAPDNVTVVLADLVPAEVDDRPTDQNAPGANNAAETEPMRLP